ncbi:DNA repair protein SWI5 homolog [Drosophila innubila]|uniref:DNA repair protein SWI5 homolog n=1 Tax=Drosophila innubila TaxID=198719 RepID=UPI00148C6E48|nr:DNA repair protein SWI5 homolog [Drosophila innubila]
MNNSKIQNIKSSKSDEQQKQKHLQLLHEYNDLKDATQTVLGALAQAKGLPVKDMYKMYNLPKGD